MTHEREMLVTDKELATTYIGAMHWIAGIDAKTLREDEYTEDQITTGINVGELFEGFENHVLELLTLFAGYVNASLEEHEDETLIDVKDFILATGIVITDDEFHRHFVRKEEE